MHDSVIGERPPYSQLWIHDSRFTILDFGFCRVKWIFSRESRIMNRESRMVHEPVTFSHEWIRDGMIAFKPNS